MLWKVSVQTECVCVAYHPSGVAIAAGTLDGHAVILNAENGSHITTLRVCGAPINALAYNRDGDVLAIGKCLTSNILVIIFSIYHILLNYIFLRYMKNFSFT